jgi:YHS domain-containing protein
MKNIMIFLFSTFLFTMCEAQKKTAPVFTTNAGAIDGYDPIGYFMQGKPIKGDANITYNWKNATWHFASTANRDLFAKNPEKYAPQYGGWCAYGWAKGYPAKIDPTAWRVVDDKLYLNYNAAVQTDWDKKQAEYIQQANKNYAKSQGQ